MFNVYYKDFIILSILPHLSFPPGGVFFFKKKNSAAICRFTFWPIPEQHLSRGSPVSNYKYHARIQRIARRLNIK